MDDKASGSSLGEKHAAGQATKQDDCKVVRLSPSRFETAGLQAWNRGFPRSRELRMALPRPCMNMKIAYFHSNDRLEAYSIVWKDFAIVLGYEGCAIDSLRRPVLRSAQRLSGRGGPARHRRRHRTTWLAHDRVPLGLWDSHPSVRSSGRSLWRSPALSARRSRALSRLPLVRAGADFSICCWRQELSRRLAVRRFPAWG